MGKEGFPVAVKLSILRLFWDFSGNLALALGNVRASLKLRMGAKMQVCKD